MGQGTSDYECQMLSGAGTNTGCWATVHHLSLQTTECVAYNIYCIQLLILHCSDSKAAKSVFQEAQHLLTQGRNAAAAN